MRRDDRGGDRGTALIEFAIAFPVLLLLLLAIVDFGVNYGNRIETAHAARETARAGSVVRMGSTTTCPLVPAAPVASDTKALLCYAKARAHQDADRVRVKFLYQGPNGKVTTTNPTTGNLNAVVVCVMSEAYSVSGMLQPLFAGRVHESRSVVKNGKPTTPFPAAGGEQPLTGQDWSFCTADDPVGTDDAAP